MFYDTVFGCRKPFSATIRVNLPFRNVESSNPADCEHKGKVNISSGHSSVD